MLGALVGGDEGGEVPFVLLQQRRDLAEPRCSRFLDLVRDDARRNVHAVQYVADIVQHIRGDPPNVEAVPLEFVDTGVRRARRDAEAHRNRLEFGAAVPFRGDVLLQSRLEAPPRRQYEHHRQNGGDDERSRDRALLTYGGGNGGLYHEFISPLEFILHRFCEPCALNDGRPQRRGGG